jgi:hypothetical protein
MHAAFADDAVQIVKQSVKRRPSLLGMNAPVRALIGLLHFTLPPGMNAERHRRHRSKAVDAVTGNSLGRAASPDKPPALRIKNST